jgi:hypothetical protein
LAQGGDLGQLWVGLSDPLDQELQVGFGVPVP